MSTASAFIRNVPLSPAVTGALLYALTQAPERYRQPLLNRLNQILSVKNIGRLVSTLKWLCAIGVVRNIHVWLSNLAQNNFRLKSERHRYNWPNEVAVVTGAASGFGALITKGLVAKGINVMALDVRTDVPEDMKMNPRIQWYQCDITNREKVMEVADKIRKQYGDPSILINNAGICYYHSVLSASEEALHRTYNVNVIAHYFTLQAFLPAMIANKKGHVVTLASMASFLSPPGIIPYAGTKSAVLSLHEGLMQEARVVYKAPEIKFTSVHPTYANTPLAAPFVKELRDKNVFVLDPQDVADAVVNQIMACTGRQLLIGDISWLAGIKAWPYWLAQGCVRATDSKYDTAPYTGEKISTG